MVSLVDAHSVLTRFDIDYTFNSANYPSVTTLPATATIGELYCHYSVKAINNVANSEFKRSYLVTCSQRLILNNPTNPISAAPLSLQSGGLGMINNPTDAYVYANLSGVKQENQTITTGYYFYPVWAMSTAKMEDTGDVFNGALLLDYQPRTLNSAVNLSNTSGATDASGNTQSSSSSRQKTLGSANTTTQNYSANLSIGSFSNIGVSASFGHDQTTDQSHSASNGASRGSDFSHNQQGTHSDSMSVKDWGVYSCVDVSAATDIPECAWFLSQEFPFNMLSTNTTSNNLLTNDIPVFPYSLNLSISEIDQLFPKDYSLAQVTYQIAPPTELGLFGGDYVQICTWRFDAEHSNSSAPILTPKHRVDALFASHFTASDRTAGQVSIVGQINPNQTVEYNGPQLDLSILALDPIQNNSGSNGAVIGFLPHRFLVPISATGQSRTVSNANNLMVLTSGFTAPTADNMYSSAVLSAALSETPFTAQLNICFKVGAFEGDLSLYLKHWVGQSSTAQECTLSVWFNPPEYKPTDTGNPTVGTGSAKTNLTPDLVISINATEGTGGENNMSVINLRNTFYDTVDYHDYLIPGQNLIVIGINSVNSEGQYNIRTVALGA